MAGEIEGLDFNDPIIAERVGIARVFTHMVREALGSAILPSVEARLLLIESLRIGEALGDPLRCGAHFTCDTCGSRFKHVCTRPRGHEGRHRGEQHSGP